MLEKGTSLGSSPKYVLPFRLGNAIVDASLVVNRSH